MPLRHLTSTGILFLLAIVAAPLSYAQYKILHTFGGKDDGSTPYSGLIIDAAGNLYGTTYLGGTYDFGTIYKFDTATGVETVLHSFAGDGTDGEYPFADLYRDAAGNLYGTTFEGGHQEWGTVFEYTNAAEFQLLYSFLGYPEDGQQPQGGVTQDSEGNLYGTTSYGGNDSLYGTVFKLSVSGVETQLYAFTGGLDGEFPSTDLIRDAHGNLYGDAAVVFKLSPSGTLTVLAPTSANNLIMDPEGNLYASAIGTASDQWGDVFKLNTKDVTETVLHSFAGIPTDGGNPEGGLARDGLGNLYGSTCYGNSNSDRGVGNGVVFEVDAGGVETILHNFEGYPADGNCGIGNLVMDAAGNLYGVTNAGGVHNDGIIFEISRK
jgi:uncharacterized repeat protein (TIGR03803 family)